MRTAQEQQLITKIAHNLDKLTSEEIEAITPDMLNSKINDGSEKSEWSVALVLAPRALGQGILEMNLTLALQIHEATLNQIIQQGPYAGQSVAFGLARFYFGCSILAANNNTLGRKVNTKTLNAIIQCGENAGESVAFALARSQEGRAILAMHNYALGSQINTETLNTVIQQGYCAGESVASVLPKTSEGRAIHAAIKERHKSNKLILALYSSKIERLGKNSAIKALHRELLDGVLTMLDGRTPQKLSLK